MAKKILIVFTSLFYLYALAVIGFRIFEPKPQATILRNSVPYPSLKNYIESSSDSTIHYLFFYSANNQNCIFVQNTILQQLQSEYQIPVDEWIETVDVTSIEQSYTTNKLITDWGIHDLPAFIRVYKQDGQIHIDENKLEWTDQTPITAKNLKEWLKATQ